MSENQSLPGALRRQAAADPESPFLFWPDGWNWRWWSWRETAELVARWAAPLAGLPPACGVAFAGAAYPEAIALDLAVQSAGLTPVPLGPLWVGGGAGGHGREGREVQRAAPALEAAERAGCLAWLEVVGGEARVTRLEASVGGAAPAAAAPGMTAAAATVPGMAEAPADPGIAAAGAMPGLAAPPPSGSAAVPLGDPGVLVTGAAGSWRLLSQSELLAAAAEVESAIASRSGRHADSRNREILVAGWPLQEWAGRLLAAWAVAAGAALVFEADPAQRLGAVLWARPTVFHGTAEELAALRLRVGAARWPRRWRRRPVPPLGRLRALFQHEPPAADDVAFWRQRGAQLVRLPGLGDAWR
ncbi:MAG TPA: AMP-binding protein [Thermoanaerobaculia bacterium]